MMRFLATMLTGLLLAACGGGGSGGAAPIPFVPRNDLLTIAEGGASTLDVLANDGDPDPGPATVTFVSLPASGTASVQADGSIRYEPDPLFNGTDSFVYSADDGASAGAATVWVTVYATAAADGPAVWLPRLSLTPREIAVLVNDQDAQSLAVGAYYAARRGIPAANVIHLDFDPSSGNLPPDDFAPVYALAQASVGPEIQAYAIAWSRPWHVAGMGITSAFALGYDEKYHAPSGTTCAPTGFVDYYDSDSTRPFADHGIRPAMMLLGATVEEAEALVERGIAADGTFPGGTSWLVRTNDGARSVRWPAMGQAEAEWDHLPDGLDVRYVETQSIENEADVFVYLTGLTTVPGIETNSYVPGAVADHLTSSGGRLDGTSQMTVLAWLQAGVTASFGTVREPCNYTEKFPDPGPLLDHYYRGNSVIEAYWKSVRWPGEGLFVGEPLARPFGRYHLERDGDDVLIRTTSLEPGRAYRILAADDPAGPFEVLTTGISVPYHRMETIRISSATRAAYRFEPVP